MTDQDTNDALDQQINDTFHALAAEHRAEHLTTEELQHLIQRAGASHGPLLLYRAWTAGKIDDTTLQALIDDVWTRAEDPHRHLNKDQWRTLWQAA